MADTLTRESQKQRWLKYGANVVLASIVVIVLAVIVVYLAQRTNRRLDTTANRAYSLKPQTQGILKDVKGKIRLVSLYASKDAKQKQSTYAEPVADLLEEYARNGKNIEAEWIDPITSPQKVDNLVN